MGDSLKKQEEMKNQENNTIEVREATAEETAQYKEQTEVKLEVKTKKVSVTYTLSRLKTNIVSLNDAKMINEEEKKILVEIYNKIKNREIGGDLEL